MDERKAPSGRRAEDGRRRKAAALAAVFSGALLTQLAALAFGGDKRKAKLSK